MVNLYGATINIPLGKSQMSAIKRHLINTFLKKRIYFLYFFYIFSNYKDYPAEFLDKTSSFKTGAMSLKRKGVSSKNKALLIFSTRL